MKILHVACLAGVLWLTGCATQAPSSSSPSDPSSAPASASDPVASAPWDRRAAPPGYKAGPYTPLLAGGPLQPITSAQASGGQVASLTAPADLWDRIRRGFAMPDLEDSLVQEREQWYATRPDYILRMTQRSSKYLFHIVEELERRGMPTELALLPYIESAFNPQAISSAKAAGMWQFMPATGNYFDLKQNAFRDDRRDVLASTRAALDYLQKLHGMFGDWHLALAAYNWGEGSVGRAIARNKKAGLGTRYTDLNMPAETRLYVPKLQAVKNIVARPEVFQTELPLIENHPYFQSVEVRRDIDVALAARLADIDESDFRALNPSLHKPVILAAGTPLILLPWDNAKVFERNLQAYTEGQYASWTVWTLPSTMSVSEVAQRVGMREADLRSINAIPPRMLVKGGSALIVPRTATMQHDVTGQVADNGQMSLTPETVTRRTVVRASRRDSVASLARRYRVSADSVADWNGVRANAAFKAGEQVVLYLPVPLGRAAVASGARAPQVRAGGTASSKKVAARRSTASRAPAPSAAQPVRRSSSAKKAVRR